MKKQYSFKMDAMKTPVIDSIRYNQQDRNSPVLVIALTQKEQVVDLTDKQISIVFLKPDGTMVTQDELNGVNVNAPLNGTFEVVLNTEVLAVAGTVTAEITITDEDTVFVCDPFKFKVEKSLRNGAETISKNDLTFMANVQNLVDAHEYLVGAEQTIITLQTDIGDTTTLKTTAKNSAVAAVNELSDKIGIVQGNVSTNTTNIASNTSQIGILNEPKYIISASTLPMYTSAEVGKEGYDIEAALNAAFTALPNGGYIQLPKGRLYSSPISVPPRIKLVGAGQYVTRLMLKNTKNADFIKFDQAEYAGIRDMAIDGNKWNNLTAGSCILIKNSSITTANSRNLEIENLTIVDAREHGIKVTKPNVWIFQLRNIKVDNCEGYGVWNDATDNSYYAIDVYGCKKGGIFEQGNNNRWIGGKAYVNGDAAYPNNAGFTLSGAKRVQVVGFEVQDDRANGFLIENSQDCTLTNILADGNGSLSQNNMTTVPPYADGIKITNSHGIIIQGTSSSYIPCQRKPYTIDSASYKITMMVQGDGNNQTPQVDSTAQINILDTTTQAIMINNLRAVGVPYVNKEPYYTLGGVASTPNFSTMDITGLNLSYSTSGTDKSLVMTMGNILLANTWTVEWEMEFSSLPSGFVDFGTITFGDATTYRLSLGNAFGYTPAMYVQSATYTTGIKANEQIVTNKVYKCSLIRTPTTLTFWVNGLFSQATTSVSDSATGISSVVFQAKNSAYNYVIRNVLVSSKSKPSYEINNFVRDDSTLIFMPLQTDLRFGKGVQTMLSESTLRLKSPSGTYFDTGASNKGTVTYNGDGVTTTKTIVHGLGATPSAFYVQKSISGLPAIDYVTADSTNLTVTFVSAPSSGTNNVVLRWKADV